MKKILFLLLFPLFCHAQYPSNANQKITLGEQTTADGLVYRGLVADTTRKPSVDTMAYIILDTTTNLIWHYKKATSNAWLRLNLLPSDTTSMLTNYYRSGRALGTPSSGVLTNATGLPIATGLTGLGAANRIPYASSTTALTTSSGLTYDGTNLGLGVTPNANWATGFKILEMTNGSSIMSHPSVPITYINTNYLATNSGATYIQSYPAARFLVNGYQGNFSWQVAGAGNAGDAITFTTAMQLNVNGRLGIGTDEPSVALHVVGNGRFSAMNGINDIGADANGVLQAATSDLNLKNTIENSPFGLNEILLLNPVTFLYNDENRKIDSNVKEVGFIAQDVFDVIPNAVSSTGTGDLQLDYRAITASLVKAMQEQQTQIEALKQRIINLENK